jgi:glc operon protein GlcG
MFGKSLVASLVLLTTAIAGQAQVLEKKALTLEAAKKISDAAAAEARRNNAGGAIAVVDDGGHLIYLERLDNTFPAAASVATDKARTAAQFRMPTRNFENAIKNGRIAIVGVPQITPFQGGVPILVDGQVIGAVGVSGAASAQQDDEIATVAATALGSDGETGRRGDGETEQDPSSRSVAPSPRRPVAERSEAPVTFIDSKTVAAAFAKGMPLVEVGEYKVHASRREAPGMAEIHVRDTDIIYVLDGSATFVTGGTAVDEKTTAPDEIRGSAIQGGDTRRITKGDVVIVPNGTPHQFRDVKGPLTYYVVKVTSANGGGK